jgi:hypothetical protein
MLKRRSMLKALGAAIVGVAMVGAAEAQGDGRGTNYLTFNTPVALPGVALGPGTYIFELADHQVSMTLVRVLSRDRNHVYLTAFTHTVERPRSLPASHVVSFGEVPAGMVPPITDWYPIGEKLGHQFIYPKNSAQLTTRAGN